MGSEGFGEHGKVSATLLESARQLAERDVPVAAPGDSRSAVLALLAARRHACATHIAVCEEGRFLGLILIEDLLAAPDGAKAMDLMDKDSLVAVNGTDREVAAWRAVQRKQSALAVVDADGTFLGLIPPLTLLEILLHEHEEDISRLGGYLKSTALARASALEKVVRRFGHRLPWLLLGLLGAAVASVIVGRFEEALRDQVLLAFFLPGIIYLADAVGTQTETVLVRGMSVGVGLRQVVVRELLTGALIGAVLSVAAFLLLLLFYGKLNVALGISLSVLAACASASASAMILPWALSRTGADPAYGSGPLATVVQDLLSIVIYFLVATRFL
jgi:magnesium transporter